MLLPLQPGDDPLDSPYTTVTVLKGLSLHLPSQKEGSGASVPYQILFLPLRLNYSFKHLNMFQSSGLVSWQVSPLGRFRGATHYSPQLQS